MFIHLVNKEWFMYEEGGAGISILLSCPPSLLLSSRFLDTFMAMEVTIVLGRWQKGIMWHVTIETLRPKKRRIRSRRSDNEIHISSQLQLSLCLEKLNHLKSYAYVRQFWRSSHVGSISPTSLIWVDRFRFRSNLIDRLGSGQIWSIDLDRTHLDRRLTRTKPCAWRLEHGFSPTSRIGSEEELQADFWSSNV